MHCGPEALDVSWTVVFWLGPNTDSIFYPWTQMQPLVCAVWYINLNLDKYTSNWWNHGFLSISFQDWGLQILQG